MGLRVPPMNSFSHKYAIRMGSSPINFSFNVFSFVRTDPEHMVMPIKPSSVYISNLARDLERVVTIEFQNGFFEALFYNSYLNICDFHCGLLYKKSEYVVALLQEYKEHPECDNGNLTCSGIACAVLGDGLSYFTMNFLRTNYQGGEGL